MHKLLVLAVSSAIGLAACGGGSGGGGDLSDEEQGFVDEVMAGFDPEEAAPLTRDDAECIAGSFVGELGTDRLAELEITPEDFSNDDFPSGLTETEADGVVDGIDDCIGLSELFLDALAADSDLSDEAKDCLVKAFDDETVREIFTKLLITGGDALQSDPEFTSEIMRILSECPGALDFG